jgi:uncharacterized LabA/DUF88 family protein
MSAAALPAGHQIDAINYYTARVSARINPASPARQNAYLQALEAIPKVQIHYGNFLVSKKWSRLVQPPDFKPTFPLPSAAAPVVAKVVKTEEKGSDVNLGVHLVRDAFKGLFDAAAVLTNDTDLKEPLRIVTRELGLQVILLMPCPQPAASLVAVSNAVRHIQPYLGPCQLPQTIFVPGKPPISKPTTW